MTGDVLVRVKGAIGNITLNRPEALNALNHPMVAAMTVALAAWSENDAIKMVLIDAGGGRAFCAGGDIRDLHRTMKTQPEMGRRFWFDEYRLNAMIASFGKPVVVFMDNTVMGGGVGISAHASHRIVTERSVVAMPEVGIGFVPDVGSTRLLADAPGELGYYLGMTAHRMTAADAIHAGFADVHVPSQHLAALTDALIETGDPAVIASFSKALPTSNLAQLQGQIDRLFGLKSAMEICTALQTDPSELACNALAAIRSASPTAVVAAHYAITQARNTPGLLGCLACEYRFAYRSLDGEEFLEGIRAAIIDKDRRPRWQPPRIEEVNPTAIAQLFANLGPNEWSA